MKFPTAIIFIVVIAACNNPTNIKTHSTVGSIKTGKIAGDSIGLIPSPFVVSNFPDTVKRVLYASEDSIWNIVLRFYSWQGKKGFATDSFNKIFGFQGFSVDSLNSDYFFWHRAFNRRTGIQIRGKSVDTISVSNQMWYRGKKYILIKDRWKF